MTSPSVGPALRAAVDASLSWYDALCALHGVPCGVDDDVWSAYAPPRPRGRAARPPGGRSSVRRPTSAWTTQHGTGAVLLPTLLHRSAFCVIGREAGGGGRPGRFGAGAVLHLGTGVVDISNVWTTTEQLDWAELIGAAAAVFPGRALVGYEHGTDLASALAAGFTAVGPQHVWIR